MLNTVPARAKLAAAITATVAVLVAAAMFVARPGDSSSAPAGYTRIGKVGTAVLFAKVADEQRMLDVVVRDQHGHDLCNGRGPLGGIHPPAICNGSVGSMYVFVAQVPKHSEPVQLCDTGTGSRAASQVVLSPATWPVDFVSFVGVHDSAVGVCSP